MIDWFFGAPRRAFALICAACFAMLVFGLYLQHVVGLEPCPMCIVQRYALLLLAILSGLAAIGRGRGGRIFWGCLGVLTCVGGAFTAARQSWLQWYPPEYVNCGRDIYGMIEAFPLQRVLPLIFRGSGDCSVVTWSFLGLSLANWSFIVFTGFAILIPVLLIWRPAAARRSPEAMANRR